MKSIKSGYGAASVKGLKSEALIAWDIADQVYDANGIAECTLTCGTDSHEDKPNSLHNSGLAIDLRISNIPGDHILKPIVKELTERLGDDYDVVLEPNHIHVEFDPK